jgi:hypothetical protein
MNHSTRATLAATSLFVAALGVYTACGDDTSVKEASPDAGTPSSPSTLDSGGADGGDDCVQNPKTYLEILNACTTATRITKTPTLSRQSRDGGLPPPGS